MPTYPYGQYPSYDSIAPQPNPEMKALRRDANYIGILVVALTLCLQRLFAYLVLLLCQLGYMQREQLSQEFLGMGNTAYLCLYSCVYAVIMAVPALVVSLGFGRRHFPLGPAKPCRGGLAFFSTFAGVGACMLISLAVGVLLSFLSQFGLPIPESPIMMVDTPVSLLLGLLVMAVLPALLEEMVFRGYILRALRPYGDGYAIVVSALLFGMIHGNIRQVPFAFVVGLVLGWLYAVTDNIWLPVAVHFCNNAVSVILEHAGLSYTDEMTAFSNGAVILLIIGMGIVSVVTLAVAYPEAFRIKKGRSTLTAGQRVTGLCKAPGFVVAVLLLLAIMVLELAG